MEEQIKIKAHLMEALREYNAAVSRIRRWVRFGIFEPRRARLNLSRCIAHLLAARRLIPSYRLKRRVTGLIERIRPLYLQMMYLEKEFRPYIGEKEILGRLAPEEKWLDELVEKMRRIKEEMDEIVEEVRA
ncbi:hypothetical protein J7L60_01885 [Candidatus Bathyarchaeota archaeon]|nr:hypothetical protein [Candidatus Bathyarchaeota archaeon]